MLLLPPRRLARVLRPAAETLALPVLGRGHRLAPGCPAAHQLAVGHDARRPASPPQQPARQAPGGPRAAAALGKDVQRPAGLAGLRRLPAAAGSLRAVSGWRTPGQPQLPAPSAVPVRGSGTADEDALRRQQLVHPAQAQGERKRSLAAWPMTFAGNGQSAQPGQADAAIPPACPAQPHPASRSAAKMTVPARRCPAALRLEAKRRMGLPRRLTPIAHSGFFRRFGVAGSNLAGPNARYG